MTKTEPVIPLMFWPALAEHPDCMVLRRAIADWLEEQGDSLGAECLRWSVECGRVPDVYDEENCSPAYGWGAAIPNHPAPFSVPSVLQSKPPVYDPAHATAPDAFIRLIGRWKNSTPEERERYWAWAAQ